MNTCTGSGDGAVAAHLRVSRDPHDASLVEVQLRLLDRGDLEEVEGRGVEKQEREQRRDPDEGVNRRIVPEIPQRNPVVPAVQTRATPPKIKTILINTIR